MARRASAAAVVCVLACIGCSRTTQVASMAAGDRREIEVPASGLDYRAMLADNGKATQTKGTRRGNPVLNYFIDRSKDFVDMFDVSAGFGPGFLVHARATKIAQAGGGYSDSWRLGMRGRTGGVFRETRREVGVSLFTWTQTDRECYAGNIEKMHAEKMELDTLDKGDRSFFGIGATVHAGIVAADVGFRPVELFDFILGLFTIDICEDDGHPARKSQL